MLTIGYVRVSTEDQVDRSPEAQRIRCGQYAKTHDLGPIQYLSDEGFSGRNLERPAMQELLALIETGEVAHLVVWRLDRLTRDTGDQSRLIRLCEKYCVSIHSVNEGPVRVDTASGRMQAGIHGVFAQYYREHVVENVRMGQDQAARNGRWQNHAPTGYDLVNGYLQPNEQAYLVRRIFQLRADGLSYSVLERATGIKYSTARHICLNRAYLGEVTHRGETFDGLHEQLVSIEQFDAAQRVHIPGRRRGKDLLSGKVRCGHCGKVLCVEFNEKGTAVYRCKHRGKGCEMPGRSAPGLHRAARLGLGLIGHDHELQEAIRHELGRHGGQAPSEASEAPRPVLRGLDHGRDVPRGGKQADTADRHHRGRGSVASAGARTATLHDKPFRARRRGPRPALARADLGQCNRAGTANTRARDGRLRRGPSRSLESRHCWRSPTSGHAGRGWPARARYGIKRVEGGT